MNTGDLTRHVAEAVGRAVVRGVIEYPASEGGPFVAEIRLRCQLPNGEAVAMWLDDAAGTAGALTESGCLLAGLADAGRRPPDAAVAAVAAAFGCRLLDGRLTREFDVADLGEDAFQFVACLLGVLALAHAGTAVPSAPRRRARR